MFDKFPSLTSADAFEALGASVLAGSTKKRVQCGRWSVRGSAAGKQIYSRVNCKCWDCARCGPKRAAHYKHAIRDQAEKNKLQRFLTLTLDPKNSIGRAEDHAIYLEHLTARKQCGCDACQKTKLASVKYIRACWSLLRKYMARALGSMPQFIAVVEFQEATGLAHLHVLLGAFVDWAWIKQTWETVGGGSHVHIKFVDVHRVSHYMAKYLTKDLLMSAPKRSRRITCSRSVQLNQKLEKEAGVLWELLKVPITELYKRWGRWAIEASYDDAEGEHLQGFVLQFNSI